MYGSMYPTVKDIAAITALSGDRDPIDIAVNKKGKEHCNPIAGRKVLTFWLCFIIGSFPITEIIPHAAMNAPK